MGSAVDCTGEAAAGVAAAGSVGNATVDFHGESRRNDTHESTTDPEAQLARKSAGHEAKLAYCGRVLIENRNGLVVDCELVPCSGTAEREAALRMAERIDGKQRVTAGADKGYDTRDFVREMRERNVTPHVSQNMKRSGGSAIDRRTTRHAGYAVSQRKRKRIEEVFGWLKFRTPTCIEPNHDALTGGIPHGELAHLGNFADRHLATLDTGPVDGDESEG